jgi:uncharacterized protein
MPADLTPRSRRFRLPRRLLSLLLLVAVAINVIAALQAHAATHFVPGAPSFEQQLAVPLPQKAWVMLNGLHIPRPLNHTTPANHNLPYEVRRIPIGSQEYLEAWSVPHPSPRGTVIMFAGYAGVKEGLLTPAAHLYRFGYSSLLVDFRGSGGSSGTDTMLGIREAEDYNGPGNSDNDLSGIV